MTEDRGFTLLETLVALAVLTVTLTSLYGLYAQSLARYQGAAEITEALEIAQNTLGSVGVERPLPSGDDVVYRTEDERWLVTIAGSEQPISGLSGPVGRWVTVTVRPATGTAAIGRPVELTTFKLGSPHP